MQLERSLWLLQNRTSLHHLGQLQAWPWLQAPAVFVPYLPLWYSKAQVLNSLASPSFAPFGWMEWLAPKSPFRFPCNLSLQMLVLQCSVKWCFAFYILKQHMVCSQLLKLTKYLRICLNARSYRKCKFITSHLILMIDFWRVLWGFFLLVLSLLCLHAYADFLSLPEPHNTCYQ